MTEMGKETDEGEESGRPTDEREEEREDRANLITPSSAMKSTRAWR